MDRPLLQTKLYIPSSRSELVPRPHLLERLNEGLQRRLTLISAPAGFGKTTLISHWIDDLCLTVDRTESSPLIDRQSKIESRAAWLSLDEGDNDVDRFFSYFIAALQQVTPHLGQTTLTMLQSPKPPASELLMTTLLNELADTATKITLILDDYHLIESQPIHKALAFLLDHLPPQLHLVITTRVDPPLPLSRLRGRDQLTELRESDLRFTVEETTTFLNKVMYLNLSATQVAALKERTEGWVTGLQLAGLSMREQADVSNFIARFTGSHRYILDYLTDEVLSRQPDEVQTFLCQTSILSRLSGPLCDAVTRRANSQTLLENLEAANLFVISLDNERRWYRYHHLFAGLLHNQLQQRHADRIPALYGRASQWFEKNGQVDEAVHYALLAKDFVRAADLIEQTAEMMLTQMLMQGGISTLLGWLKALPDEVVHSRFLLCVTFAWTLLMTARRPEDMTAVEALLQIAKGQIHQDETKNFIESRGHLAALRSYLALSRNDYPGSITLARQALPDLPKDNRFLRGAISFNLATAYWLNGDVVAAGRAYREAAADSRAVGNFFVALEAMNNLGTMEAEQGHLHQAIAFHRQAVQIAHEPFEQQDGPPLFAGPAYLGTAEVLREWNQLTEASLALETGLSLARQGNFLEGQLVGRIISARVRQAQGDSSEALAAIAAARQLFRPGELAAFTPWLAAVEARLWLAQGNLSAATRWAQNCGLTRQDDEGAFQRYPGEYTTLARVYIVQETDEPQTAALDLLTRMLTALESKGRMGRVIEILALQALAYQTQNNLSAALTTLKQALMLAEPAGYIRLFVDEGPPMAALLKRLTNDRQPQTLADYLPKLLAAFPDGESDEAETSNRQPNMTMLIEPLSERELEILHLIAAGYANREIADTLVIALGTVKRHVSNIYGKLGVQSRTQATAKGRDLGLL